MNLLIEFIEEVAGRKLTDLEIQLIRASYTKGYSNGRLKTLKDIQNMLKK